MSVKIVARISWLVTVHLMIACQMKVVVAILASFHCVMNFSLIGIGCSHDLPGVLIVIYKCILVALFNHWFSLQALRGTILQKAVLDRIKLQVRNPKFLNWATITPIRVFFSVICIMHFTSVRLGQHIRFIHSKGTFGRARDIQNTLVVFTWSIRK